MVSLGNFASEFAIDGITINQPAEVFSEFNGKLNIVVRIPCSAEEQIRAFFSSRLKLRLAGSDWVDCIPTHSDDQDKFIQVAPLRSPIVISGNERICKLTFLLGDLPNLKGKQVLISSEWSLTIVGKIDVSATDPNKAKADSALTHEGTLERTDGSLFTCAEASRCLVHICKFFSFCYERWASIANVEGKNPDGKIVFWQLGAGKLDIVDASSIESNWLDGFQPDKALQQLFPGFMKRIADENWEETLSLAIYWYVRGSTSNAGPDGSIIILQAALERLAWQFLVQDLRILSEDGFSKLSAADLLRLLLSHHKIPLKIPAEQYKLISTGKGLGWCDGADAVVQTRNKVVHPPRKKRVVSLDYYGAYTVAKWYLELILLHLGGFEGEYSNRTIAVRWSGQTEPVPWKS